MSWLGLLVLFGQSFLDLFRSRASLEAERLVLRQELTVLKERQSKRIRLQPGGSDVLGPHVKTLGQVARRIGDSRARYCVAMAPRRIQIDLATKTSSGRTTAPGEGASGAHPLDQREKCSLGSAKDPRRSSKARDQRLTNDGRQVHGAEDDAPIAELASFPTKSRSGTDQQR